MGKKNLNMSAFVTKPAIGKSFSNEIRAIADKNRHIIDEEYMEELKEAFTLFDSDHNGTIDLRELKAALRALDYDVTKNQCIAMFREVDTDPSGSLNFEKFIKVMAPKLKNKDSKEEAKKTFDLFDVNGVS